MEGRRALGAAAACLLAAGLAACGTATAGRGAESRPAAARARPAAVATTVAAIPATSHPTASSTTTSSTVVPTTPRPTRAAAPPSTAVPAVATLAGCPVAPHPPVTSPPPWHPSVLVPDRALPAVTPPAAWRSDVAALRGTGMWIWQWDRTGGGDAARVVARATAAHLHQLWVRVGDSKDGFYGAAELAALVPAAHAAGLAVIAWGFPYLYDPVGDAAWTEQVLAWRGPGGVQVDGFSADIERPSEGVDLSARRAAVYLEYVRRDAGARLVVATVYPPIDSYWSGGYPYQAMAPYVDAFAPMIYWECTDPGADARLDVARLATLRPVQVIGQAFDMADVGGRIPAPSGAEIDEFLRASRAAGAVGASFWVWQDATPDEWAAITGYLW